MLPGWAMGDGRMGSDENFEYIRDQIYAPDRQTVFKGLDRAKLKNVAVQFYTQHGSREQPGYAFIHKSFGEYLTARALIKASKAWCEEYAKRNKWGSFAEDWLRLAGRRHYTDEILAFMIDEARLQVKPSSSDHPNLDRARKLVVQLCQVVNMTLYEGFPAHRISPAANPGEAWRNREAYQRNAETALYAAVHAWGEAGYPHALLNADGTEGGWLAGPIRIDWQVLATLPAMAIINRAKGHWDNEGQIRPLFARWHFGSKQQLSSYDLRRFDLSRAKLFEADCSRMRIYSARLQSADFSNAVNLEQEQIDKAFGNSETKLPNGMRLPEAWLKDD